MKPSKDGRIMTMSEREFRRLFDKKSQTELARILGVTQPAVAYWAKKLGLESKGCNKKLEIRQGE